MLDRFDNPQPMESTKRKCKAITLSGLPCDAFAMSDSEYCYFHDPTLETQRKENSIYGGRTRKYVKLEGDKVEITDINSIMGIVNEVISNLRVMDISVQQAKALLDAASVAMQVLEARDLTERVEKLEEGMKKEVSND